MRLAGNRKVLALDLYARFGPGEFSIRDCDIAQSTLKHLHQDGVLLMTHRDGHNTPHRYRLSDLALERLRASV